MFSVLGFAAMAMATMLIPLESVTAESALLEQMLL